MLGSHPVDFFQEEKSVKFLRVCILTSLVLTCSSFAQAPKAEIFAGYSLERIAPCGTTTGAQGASCGLELGELATSTTNYNGWNASATGYFNRYLGVTADVAGLYGSFFNGTVSTPRYGFLFGPTFRFPASKFTPFAHALFGAIRQTSSESILSFTEQATAIGGGVDMNLSRRLAVRLGQFDYEWVKNPTGGLPSAHGLRYSGGVVFKF
jgi:hypothetical protein